MDWGQYVPLNSTSIPLKLSNYLKPIPTTTVFRDIAKKSSFMTPMGEMPSLINLLFYQRFPLTFSRWALFPPKDLLVDDSGFHGLGNRPGYQR